MTEIMIRISATKAYQGMDKIDLSVMDDELHLCFGTDQRDERKQTHQFYLDNKNNIILNIYWNNEKVHTVAFDNKGDLTEQGKEWMKKGDNSE